MGKLVSTGLESLLLIDVEHDLNLFLFKNRRKYKESY